jgi:hypothetical protein
MPLAGYEKRMKKQKWERNMGERKEGDKRVKECKNWWGNSFNMKGGQMAGRKAARLDHSLMELSTS